MDRVDVDAGGGNANAPAPAPARPGMLAGAGPGEGCCLLFCLLCFERFFVSLWRSSFLGLMSDCSAVRAGDTWVEAKAVLKTWRVRAGRFPAVALLDECVPRQNRICRVKKEMRDNSVSEPWVWNHKQRSLPGEGVVTAQPLSSPCLSIKVRDFVRVEG